MCDCDQKKCCCNEKRVSVQGKGGLDGRNGSSAFVYIAYASNVVPGTPDVVTGFSTTTPDCYLAIKNSPVALSPTQSIFQGLWKKVCGANGNPGSNYSFQSTGGGSVINISNGAGNLNTSIATGASMTVAFAGIYVANADILSAFINYASANSSGFAELIFELRVNGILSYYDQRGISNTITSLNYKPSLTTILNLHVGDVVSTSIKLTSSRTDESANISGGSHIIIQQVG